MNEITVEIDEKTDNVNYTRNDKIDINNDKPHNAHNGKPITKIEVSPNEKYLITYSQEDNSIAGWNIGDNDEGPLKLDHHNVKLYDINEEIADLGKICISDEKKLAYIGSSKCISK
jgi:WD40 repeat protein